MIEEVALSKQSGEREVTVSGTVRRQDVTVEEIDRKSDQSQKVLRQGTRKQAIANSSDAQGIRPVSSSEPRHLFPRFT